MIRKPELAAHEITYKRIFLLGELPAPLTRPDEHWQIFDDYSAWPEFRLRQIRLPQSRQWFRTREEIIYSETVKGSGEEITRTLLPEDETGAGGMHPEKEIRKNRYFLEYESGEFAVDVFLGALWGLVMAQANFAGEEETALFPVPEFALLDVSNNKFFRGENLVQASFEEVKAQYARSFIL